MRFQWHGGDLEMLDHPYNATITNERAIEIPIVLDAMRAIAAGDKVLEVGNVLAHYADVVELPERRVVDRYEEWAHVDPVDIFSIEGMYDFVVSISTIEHVRFSGEETQNPWGAIAALAYLRGLIAPGGVMIVTAGLGQNRALDRFLLKPDGDAADAFDGLHRHTYSRLSHDGAPLGRWVEPERFLTSKQIAYGPTHGANSVWIGEWA